MHIRFCSFSAPLSTVFLCLARRLFLVHFERGPAELRSMCTPCGRSVPAQSGFRCLSCSPALLPPLTVPAPFADFPAHLAWCPFSPLFLFFVSRVQCRAPSKHLYFARFPVPESQRFTSPRPCFFVLACAPTQSIVPLP
ncbi:hypothetical protein TRVL_05246 [Trypanosoma vivax]|nr:hypothetical protein TRVL_05246 [Trypanosoma vivax]